VCPHAQDIKVGWETVPSAIVIKGTVSAESQSFNKIVVGFRVGASIVRTIKVDNAHVDTQNSASATVDSQGAFTLTLEGDGDTKDPITLNVSTPDGTEVYRTELAQEQVQQPLAIKVEGLEQLNIQPIETQAGRINGRVIDENGTAIPSGLPVVIWAVDANDADDDQTPVPVVISKTQSGGYFSADWTAHAFSNAYGRVNGSKAVPIPLDDAKRLPNRILLVLDVPEKDDDDHRTVPAVAPDPRDLTNNPAEFSQDLGRGCIDLTTPNRTIEEFTYNMVVRTSEPDVKGVTLNARRTVPPRLLDQLVDASMLHELITTGKAANSVSIKDIDLDVHTAAQLVVNDHPATASEIKRAAWLSETGWIKDLIGAVIDPPVRQILDADTAIDWDLTPTLYEAVTLARGHILEYREVWRADGYSLGDLLNSLPLAPGQRRRIAVVDWERRTTTAREESLEYEEQLDAFVSRDRDINEIVGSRLGEELRAGSQNTTWGASGGIGAGFIGTGFGIFGGVSGSSGGSQSSAWQDSSRQFAGDSLQSLRDRVMQRSSSVRDQRSTVVQTAAQGETLRAETETVANYNHCHAMTVEYFEVLRHFLITHELADVRECLFIPMPMNQFDRGKALRWQTPLAGRLKDPKLLPGFGAVRRIADNWEGWDYPLSRYSEEPLQVLQGELRVSFVLPRPRDKDDGAYDPMAWKFYIPFLSESANELWTRKIQKSIADYGAEQIAQRDRDFRDKVAPEIAKSVVEHMRFWFVTADGSEFEVPLDATLVSRYAEGIPLYVTLRPRGELPAIPREQISQFKITLASFNAPILGDVDVLPIDAQVIVNTAKARYETEHKTFLLFNESRVLNDLSGGDPVYLPTPVSWSETRNPRDEDRRLADRLLDHLNNALEFYHQAIWGWFDPERRFMLLDSILVPGLNGKSVASVVENRVIGIAGNSLIMPVAPGIRLDPRVNNESEGDLIDLYAVDNPPPMRVSVPTRGVYAEAILGDCNSCEEIDDSRYWRWTDAGMLEPPEIAPVDTGTRTDGEDDLTPTPLPKPLVSIQNAPELPTPTGLGEVFKLLAKGDTFTDITGLEGTQKNARAAFDAALSTASAMATQAAGLAKQNITATNGERMLDRIQQAKASNLLTPDVAQDLSQKVLGSMVGSPDKEADKKADSPAADPAVQKAIEKATQSSKADIKVATSDETIEMSFDGGDTKVGGATIPSVLDVDDWITQTVIKDTPKAEANSTWSIKSKRFDKLADLKAAYPAAVSAIENRFLRADPADATKYQLFRRLRIVHPADSAIPNKVTGTAKMPLAVLVHGNHGAWGSGGAEIRNHDGYSYLQEHLAQLGIISVSVDTNAANYFDSFLEMRAEMILAAIERMRELTKLPSSRFYERIDFDNIALLGHSRGGDAVVRAAKLNSPRKHGVIKAVVSLAPTDFTGRMVSPSDRLGVTWADANAYAVVYGGLDGDVSGSRGALGFGGSGFRHYDRCETSKAMVYIPGCSHNRFNRTWSADERGIKSTDISRLHSRADHEKLLNEYFGAMCEWQLLGKEPKKALWTGIATNSLGHDVSLQHALGSKEFFIESFDAAAPLTAFARRTTKSEMAEFTDLKIAGKSIAEHVPHQTHILAGEENLPATPPIILELEFIAPESNWTGYELLTFTLGSGVDLTDATSIKNAAYPAFQVVLIDGAGKSEVIDSTSFLAVDHPMKPVYHHVLEYPSNPTLPPKNVDATMYHLETVSISLTNRPIAIDNIKKLQFIPVASFKDRIFIDSIRLVNP
jgi:acetyl esterase/lipase